MRPNPDRVFPTRNAQRKTMESQPPLSLPHPCENYGARLGHFNDRLPQQLPIEARKLSKWAINRSQPRALLHRPPTVGRQDHASQVGGVIAE